MTTPSSTADSHAGTRSIPVFECADDFNADLGRIRWQGALTVFWRDCEGWPPGWYYVAPYHAPGDEPSGPYATSAAAYACAVGW